MARKWFCRNGKAELGPLSSDEVRQLAERGIIRPDTMVRTQSMTTWVKASSVDGMFPGRPASATPSGKSS